MSREALRSAAATEVDRWEQALTDELLRLFDRQQAVVLARLQGTKARKHTRHWQPPGDRPLEVKQIIDPLRWIADAVGSLNPILRRLFAGVYGRVSKGLDAAAPAEPPEGDSRVDDAVKVQLDNIAVGVENAVKEVEDYIASEEAAGTAMPAIVEGVQGMYSSRAPVWAQRIATLSAVGAINQSALFAAADRGAFAKQWLSRRDDKVRDTHVHADGQVRLLDERFRLGGIPSHPAKSLLLFPGDPAPSVPIDETINCRCTMIFSPPRKQAVKDAGLELEVKDRVRTPAGAAHYGQPIGSVIVPGGPGLTPAFSGAGGGHTAAAAPSVGTGATPKVVGRVAGGDVILAGGDPQVRALVAKYSPSGVAPDPATSEVLALRDRKGRIGAYVVWATADGGKPKGSILQVSVHPALQGQRIGDQLVQLAAKQDPSIQPTTRPATSVPSRNPRVTTPSVAAPSRPATDANGNPVIRSRAQAGDTPGTSGDFDADAKRIERLQQAYLRDRQDTTSLFSRGGRWTAAREKQQQAVIDHFLNQPGVKKDRKILVLGGLPGAGKTTTINSAAGQQALGIDLGDYVTVNADEVKAEMVKRGMVPDYPGLTADESATLYHAESFEIAHSLMRQAAKRNLNFAYDTSLKSSSQVGFATSAGSRTAPPPWETTILFVDVPLPVAKQRARDRYLAGGRYMPLALIDGMRAYGGGRGPKRNSLPAQEFDSVKSQAHKWVVVDNAGAAPVVVAQGGRNARRP